MRLSLEARLMNNCCGRWLWDSAVEGFRGSAEVNLGASLEVSFKCIKYDVWFIASAGCKLGVLDSTTRAQWAFWL